MTRVPLIAALAAACALALSPGAAAAATGPQVRATVKSGADWLDSQQNTAGTWSGFGGANVPSALAAAGRNAADVSQPGGINAQNGLATTLNGSGFATPSSPSDSSDRVGNIERGVLESYSAGLDPQRIGPGQNLAAQLAGYYNGGYFSAQVAPGDTDVRSTNFAVFGALALERLDAPQFLVNRTVAAVRSNQHTDGGWDFPYAGSDATRGAASVPDVTGAALAALCLSGAGQNDPSVRQGVEFLEQSQIQSGGLAGSEGAFAYFGGGDADSTGWAVSGLNACGIDPQGARFTTDTNGLTPVDFLRSLQITSGQNTGAFLYNPGDPFNLGPNLAATQDAVRALAGETFSAEPPTRTDPSQPRHATPPAVADGTSVPIALAVDDGSGGVTFCRVTVPSGSSLATVLATADGSSAPAGCATGGAFTSGQLSRLNGQTGTWAYSSGGDEQVATNQTVRSGDFVSLRRTSNAVPATPGGGSSGGFVAAAEQAKTVAARISAKRLAVSARKRVASVQVTCAKSNRLCQGAVYIVYAKHTLGHRAFLIGGGKATKLGVSISKRQFKRLGKKSHKVKVNLFSRDGNGIASTSSRTVVLAPTR